MQIRSYNLTNANPRVRVSSFAFPLFLIKSTFFTGPIWLNRSSSSFDVIWNGKLRTNIVVFVLESLILDAKSY